MPTPEPVPHARHARGVGLRPRGGGLANIFEEGHFIHEKYQTWLWDMGVLEGLWGCRVCHHEWWATSPAVCARCASSFIVYREVPLESDELMIIGHGDGIWNDAAESGARELIEIKSIGLRTIEIEAPGFYKKYTDHEVDLVGLWKMIKRPFPQHLRQGMLYCHVTGIHEIVFLYEFKANQDFKAFTVRYQPESDRVPCRKCTGGEDGDGDRWYGEATDVGTGRGQPDLQGLSLPLGVLAPMTARAQDQRHQQCVRLRRAHRCRRTASLVPDVPGPQPPMVPLDLGELTADEMMNLFAEFSCLGRLRRRQGRRGRGGGGGRRG